MERMDLNFVSSEHSKKVFLDSQFDKMHETTKQKVGVVKITKPLEVLFEGADLDIYNPLTSEEISQDVSLINDLNQIPESYAYLSVGHWMQGDMGEDRKNMGLLVKAFYETFKNKKKKPALILKTSSAGASYMDRNQILKKISKLKKSVASKNIPNIYLLHGELSDVEMNLLYNHPKVKTMVSLTKGEGFGRPLLEFSLTKKPIIVSGYSGHMDFLNPEFNVMLKGSLTNVHKSAAVPNMILEDTKWFSPSHPEIGNAFKNTFENYKNYQALGKRQAHLSKTEFSWDQMHTKFDQLLSKYLDKLPKEVPLNMPKMNLPKLNLPKKK
jgi:glycosyltransferase involved in cell wall biosynthesis